MPPSYVHTAKCTTLGVYCNQYGAGHYFHIYLHVSGNHHDDGDVQSCGSKPQRKQMSMLKDTSYPHVYDSPTTCHMKSVNVYHRHASKHHAKTPRIHAGTPGLVKGNKKAAGDLSIFRRSITATKPKEGRRFTSKKKLKAGGRRKK